MYGLNPMAGVVEGFRWALLGANDGARADDRGLRRRGAGSAGRRRVLLPADGEDVRRRRLSDSWRSHSRRRISASGTASGQARSVPDAPRDDLGARDGAVRRAARRLAGGNGARPSRRDHLGAPGRVVRGRAGRGGRASSAATAPARARCSRFCRASPSRPRAAPEIQRPGRLAARGGHRLSPGADRPREHLSERRDPRHAQAARSTRKFDEIVAFAEVERFIDTPVKHYSSGMYLRLAFAVAAHLEPEILLVDEVLAVGDARFQRSAWARWRTSASGAGRCSSSPTTCRRSRGCARGRSCWISGGVAADGPSHKVVASYLSSDIGTTAERRWSDPRRAPASRAARLVAVRVRSVGGEVTDAPDISKPIGIEMEFDVLEEGWSFSASYDFYNEEGLLLFGSIETDPEWRNKRRPIGRYATTAWVPANLFSEGTVIVNVELLTVHPLTRHFEERQAVAFHLVDSMDGDSARGDWGGEWSGRSVRCSRGEPASCLPANRTPVSRGSGRACSVARRTCSTSDAATSGVCSGAPSAASVSGSSATTGRGETRGSASRTQPARPRNIRRPDGVPPALPRSLPRRASLRARPSGRFRRENGGRDLR